LLFDSLLHQELPVSIKVVIADDQQIIRKGLASLFENTEIEIVGEAATGDEAVSQTLTHTPTVLLMDVMMPETDGLDALEKLRDQAPQTKVVMMSAHDNPTYVARSVALGADGFVLKDAAGEEIIAAVQRAQRGEEPPADSRLFEIKTRLATRLDPVADDVPLTKREYQVLRHLAYGLSNREIGRSLNISIETVKEHVQNILRKLDAADRTEAAVWAVKRGLA
jgi:DNA-binding NarL/FixJ family response regulator